MTKQQLLNKVAKHMLTQNEKSMAKVPFPGCYYKHPEKNLKCAAGCLLSAKNYSLISEFALVNNKQNQEIFEKIVGKKNMMFLTHLQYIHDQCSVESWAIELRKTAEDHNLDVNF